MCVWREGKAGALAVWPKKPTRNTINKTPMWIVGVDCARSVIYGRLRIEPAGAGYCRFPGERTEEWVGQLLSETLNTTYSRGVPVPVREWKPKRGVRTEVLDARVYGCSALCGPGVDGTEARYRYADVMDIATKNPVLCIPAKLA